MPNVAETAAGSRDQRQDVFGSGSPRASGTVRRTGEVAAEKILLPLDADGGSAHTPWHRVRGSPVHAVVPCRVACDWRSWPAGERGCRGSQDRVASECPRRPRTAPRAARKDVRGARRSRPALTRRAETEPSQVGRGRDPTTARTQEAAVIRMLLRVTEAADQLSVSRAKVYELIRSGELASVRIVGARRIRVRDLEAFVSRLGGAA
jgi:excisionase family DNA binding protein